jgi:hypothetical protein
MPVLHVEVEWHADRAAASSHEHVLREVGDELVAVEAQDVVDRDQLVVEDVHVLCERRR